MMVDATESKGARREGEGGLGRESAGHGSLHHAEIYQQVQTRIDGIRYSTSLLLVIMGEREILNERHCIGIEEQKKRTGRRLEQNILYLQGVESAL